ncbi:hypothetical protein [Humisphaera borealis]|uniref:Uncharacterized protein n=1 Tax=Humisphaera borealis TaxID=2807512 RepID=A0A7M2WZI9_9BACT|nr:hypothetical protein [Humisphaera borealis]QOV90885.1 hypothetical protein IPV69_05865 [Humisphaera borealis]
MLIDQDTKPNNVPLWDLQLRIGGKTFTVREVTLKEFATMRLALPREAEIQQILGLVSDADAGGLRELLEDDDVRDDVTTTIGAYMGSHLEKKRAARRNQVRAAMGLAAI